MDLLRRGAWEEDEGLAAGGLPHDPKGWKIRRPNVDHTGQPFGLVVSDSRARYSYRSASIGSRLAAFHAG